MVFPGSHVHDTTIWRDENPWRSFLQLVLCVEASVGQFPNEKLLLFRISIPDGHGLIEKFESRITFRDQRKWKRFGRENTMSNFQHQTSEEAFTWKALGTWERIAHSSISSSYIFLLGKNSSIE